MISPTEVTRVNLLKSHELLACRCRIAPKLCQEVNNAALLGDFLFRDIQLSNSLNEIVHDGLTIHLPTCPLDSGEMVVESYGRTARVCEFFCELRARLGESEDVHENAICSQCGELIPHAMVGEIREMVDYCAYLE